MKARFALALFTLAAIVGLDLAAGALFNVDPTSAFRRRHPYYHHDFKPSVRAMTSWGKRRYEIQTNSLGFRDHRQRNIPLEADLRRILLLGDSFTEGVGVTWSESMAGRLARRSADGLEILNAGVIGYSPKIYRLKAEWLLDHLGLVVDELFVFIDMSDIPNEIIYASWKPRGLEAPAPAPLSPWRSLAHHSLLLDRVGRLVGADPPETSWNFHGMPFAEDMPPTFRDPAFADHGHWTMAYKYAKPGFALASQHMNALAELCAQHDLPLTLVVHPWPKNILAREGEHAQVLHWRRFAAERGLRFLNLFPVFIPGDRDPREMVARYFIADDVHWNAEGHRLVAQHVAPLMASGEAGP